MDRRRYVINLHLLEACNYQCRYCFSKFCDKKVLAIDKWRQIVNNISKSIPVKRFNIAGGEPLLYPEIEKLIKYIKDKGYKVSLITNGSFLTTNFIARNKKLIYMIGISIDSFNQEINLSLGRKTNKNEVLTAKQIKNLCDVIKKNEIKLKINTVVNKYNCSEDLREDLSIIDLDRWKVLRLKIFETNNWSNKNLAVTDREFQRFVDRHKNIENIVVESSMKNSYIIIDPLGNLIDNSDVRDYNILGNALTNNFKNVFKRLNLDEELYSKRYVDLL